MLVEVSIRFYIYFMLDFWHKFLYDIGIVNTLEPFMKLLNQGMITSFAYKTKEGRIIPVDKVYEKDSQFFETGSDKRLEKSGN